MPGTKIITMDINPLVNLEQRLEGRKSNLYVGNDDLASRSPRTYQDLVDHTGTSFDMSIAYPPSGDALKSAKSISSKILKGKFPFDFNEYREWVDKGLPIKKPVSTRAPSPREIVEILAGHYLENTSERADGSDIQLAHGATRLFINMSNHFKDHEDHYELTIPAQISDNTLFQVVSLYNKLCLVPLQDDFELCDRRGDYALVKFRREGGIGGKTHNEAKFSYIIPVKLLFDGLKQ